MSAKSRRRTGGGWVLVWILILAMGAGVAAGLIVSWWLWPVEYTDVSPDTLHSYHRAEYIVLISHAYAHDTDLRRAQVRLAALGDLGSVGVEVVTLAEQYAVQGRDVRDTQSLARLAYALGHRRAALAPFMPGGAPTPTWTPWPTATAVPTETPAPTSTPTLPPLVTPTATVTPAATATPTRSNALTATVVLTETATARGTATPSPTLALPRSTRVPTVTPGPTGTPRATATRRPTNTPRPTLTPTVTSTPEPRFVLTRQERRCAGTTSAGSLVRVTVLDAEGQPLPNVELLIRWQDGEDRFYTGLKPEQGAGYADYRLVADKSYQVGIVGMASDFAQEIVADACFDGTPAGWDLVFRLRDGAQ